MLGFGTYLIHTEPEKHNFAADLDVTFFVDQAGHCTFICGTTQHLAEGVFFSGSHINYRNQPQAEERLSDIMGKIGKFLYQSVVQKSVANIAGELDSKSSG